MERITPQILEITQEFILGYKEKNFKSIWNALHPIEQNRIEKFVKENYSIEELEDFIFYQLNQRFNNLPENTALASNIKINNFGVEYVLIVDDKYSNITYIKPTQITSIPLPIKKFNDIYKIKIYDD